jgi:ParB-like chromosome segregation protein Spo0J
MKLDFRKHADLRLSGDGFANPRETVDPIKLRELAAQIGWDGLRSPLLVTGGDVIIAGQRRWLAIGMLIMFRRAYLDTSNEPSDLEIDQIARDIGLVDPGEGMIGEIHVRLLEHAAALESAIPVIVLAAADDIEAIALADNLQREEMTSYEIAQRLAHLHEQGATGANLARMTGKSKSWVSRKLSAWGGAGAALRNAWCRGELAEDAVQQLAELDAAAQEKALANGTPRATRGPANRPGIDTVKAVLADLEPRWADARPLGDRLYAKGIRDALRWVSGHPADTDLLQLINTSLTD